MRLAICKISHRSILYLNPRLSTSTLVYALFWWELMLAAPLTSRDLYELRTDPSSLSCADLRRGNENNEQGGPMQSGSCPTGPHCTMGHRTDRAQGALITRPVHPTGRERAEGSNDDGWRSSRALEVDRSERQEWGLWLGLFRGSKVLAAWGTLSTREFEMSPTVPDLAVLVLLFHHMQEYTQEISCKIIKNFLLTYNNFIQGQEIRSCSWFMLLEQQELGEALKPVTSKSHSMRMCRCWTCLGKRPHDREHTLLSHYS